MHVCANCLSTLNNYILFGNSLLSQEHEVSNFIKIENSLRRYFRNGTDFKRSLIFNVFHIFSLLCISKVLKDGSLQNEKGILWYIKIAQYAKKRRPIPFYRILTSQSMKLKLLGIEGLIRPPSTKMHLILLNRHVFKFWSALAQFQLKLNSI